MTSEGDPQSADPAAAADVSVLSAGGRYSHHALVDPFQRNFPRRTKVVIALDLGRFSKQLGVDSESAQRFEKTTEPLRRRVENTVHPFGIVKAIAERAIRSGCCPIGNGPGVGVSP